MRVASESGYDIVTTDKAVQCPMLAIVDFSSTHHGHYKARYSMHTPQDTMQCVNGSDCVAYLTKPLQR